MDGGFSPPDEKPDEKPAKDTYPSVGDSVGGQKIDNALGACFSELYCRAETIDAVRRIFTEKCST